MRCIYNHYFLFVVPNGFRIPGMNGGNVVMIGFIVVVVGLVVVRVVVTGVVVVGRVVVDEVVVTGVVNKVDNFFEESVVNGVVAALVVTEVLLSAVRNQCINVTEKNH